MLLSLLVTVLLSSAPPGPPAPSEVEGSLRAGNAAYSRRGEPAQLAEAIRQYGLAASLRSTDPVPLLALARSHAFRAQSSPGAAPDAWREAARAAEKALRASCPAFAQSIDRGEYPARAAAVVDAAGAEPLYWLALSTMGMAQTRGVAAVLAVKDHSRAMMERVAQLEEKIDHGGPRRALGTWLATLPSAAGGGAAAARAQFERARALAPAYQLTRVREAETLAVLLQDAKRFDALLSEVFKFDLGSAPAIAPENRMAKQLAQALAARRDLLF